MRFERESKQLALLEGYLLGSKLKAQGKPIFAFYVVKWDRVNTLALWEVTHYRK